MTSARTLPVAAADELLARYNICGDRGQIDEVVALFTPDGRLTIPLWSAQGRDEIARCLKLGASFGETRPSFVRHHLTTSAVSWAGDDIAARTYFQVITDVGLDHSGVYVDRLVQTGDAWAFRERDVRIDWKAPNSLFPNLPARKGQA